jgi:hypothetical protein
METLKQLPRDLQVVLGGTVLYLIMSFLDWQQVSFGPVSAGVTEWHGIGIVAGLLAIVLLAWEASRLFAIKIELGPLTPGLTSIGLALLLLVFTVITFLSHSAYRHWPEYLGLVLSIAIATAAVRRARGEGVEVPKNIGSAISATTAAGSGGTSGNRTGADPEPAPESSSGHSDGPTQDAG